MISRTDDARLRIAYVSAHFHAHAGAFLMAELFERHDRSKFEIFAVSLCPSDGSTMRQRLERAFDHFIDGTGMSDAAIVRTLRDAGIHIAVDRTGYTKECRPGIFARGPAPITVNYLAYPGSLGSPNIDYLIADPIVIPPEARTHFTEKIVYLPDCYQVNDTRCEIAADAPGRGDLGLPCEGFVFCCFNNTHKYNPETFDTWMRILRSVPDSVLWLYADNAAARENLAREALARGVAPSRLIFAPHFAHDRHLARVALADLFLDTLPYNAHTTASDALRMGVPVLTCPGHAFPARVAASLLQAVGLPEMVAGSMEDYAETAISLASGPMRISALKAMLAAERPASALFDVERFRRHIETAYRTMWDIHCAGGPPRPFAVKPIEASAEPR